MNQEKQPEALMLADFYDQFDDAISMKSAGILRLLHALTESQRAELVAEAARTAEEKLLANQMTEQHRMQTNMRKEIEEENQQLRGQYDAAASVVEELQAQLSTIGAGGVEALRKPAQAVAVPSDVILPTVIHSYAAISERLRRACLSVRSKSYPLSELIPIMQNAADALDQAQEHATQLAGQGWQDIQQTWSINYTDERDFCLAASPLIGATYVVGEDAVKRLNESAWGRSHFGKVSASGPLTTPAQEHKDEQA